uniref:Uncharacterized protein n=1 Tax=Amphimedon queenslandica TaxID=400682 RepID=A0A1X7VWU0_AMPQE
TENTTLLHSVHRANTCVRITPSLMKLKIHLISIVMYKAS